MGSRLDAWQLKDVKKEKEDTYTLYISTTTQIPVYYEIYGYNSLLDSHYDEYRIRYTNFTASFDPHAFDSPISGT